MNRSRVLSMMLVLLVFGALAACAPAVREVQRPVVIVVAGPTERPVVGLADAMRGALRREGFVGSFGPEIVAAIAQRRNLSDAQALRTSAELGRIGGGDVALYVGVTRIEREVPREARADRREVIVRLQLRATLVDPSTGALLWSTRDALRTAVRMERTALEIPRLQEDPGILALRDEAVRALATLVMERLGDEGF
jgi:hypothetical protein